MRRARLFAVLLDALVSVAVADGAALAVTAVLWLWIPAGRWLTGWAWGLAGAAAVLAFLLRDAHGGRARRWMALEAVDGQGRPPGLAGSIRRNLPLIVPVWNLWDVWPVLADGAAARRSDRGRGIRVVAAS